ncbi:pre-RNA processing PIH1/Nop17, putative [Trypanosoma equiperdum]|uniref:PIH1 domain-containing protein 1 n=1 Tax=Trypanosoma equiperdum TaxID=5694 RepID=A0A1G4ICI2_TRYEQ|nr:pre-RNA processing PIH1/Nop17, putative [Trypanosoma equiperdum]
MTDTQKAGAALLQNPQFMEIFQRAMGGEENIKNIPPEGDPQREKWLADLQKKIQEESMKSAKAKLEEIHSDENGQWMYILPEPGFCVKCKVAGGGKVFVNVCKHERIAEPIPIDDDNEAEVKFRIPLSCGQARAESDKSGKPCKVYDVIVNPSTIHRCTQDHDFRCFVISLCIHWIQQKSEPTLNLQEYRNMSFRVKGTLEPQRIRLSTTPKVANALGDEIRLPANATAASPVTNVGGRSGTGKLVQEITDAPAPAAAPAPPPTVNSPSPPEEPKPSVMRLESEGIYDWSTHSKPTINPYFRETVPAAYLVELHIPTVTTIAEVDVRVSPKRIELLYVDCEDGVPFLTVPLGYPIDEELQDAKFVRKTRTLKLKLRVKLPDETSDLGTKPDVDAALLEEEEQRIERERREKELLEHKQKMERLREEEEKVMQERKSYVENLAAVQQGEIPPALKEEMDKLPPGQLTVMLHRLESKTRKGDSIDAMLENFPDSIVGSICRYIRGKLGLEQRVTGNGCGREAQVHQKTVPQPSPATCDGTTGSSAAKAATTGELTATSASRIEYNFAKKSEKLFGVAFHNRYLFALD